jgi:cytochrome c biogenesis protein CcdA
MADCQGGRYVAMLIFLLLGISLLFPSVAELFSRPLVSAGAKLQRHPSAEGGIGRSFILGISTGMLWAPCAGPILGLILTGAALQGPGARSSVLLLSFALGAATSLGIALFAGNKVFSAMKRSLSCFHTAEAGRNRRASPRRNYSDTSATSFVSWG